MSLTPEMMYWITRGDGFVRAGVIFAILSVFAVVFTTMYVLIEEGRLFSKFLCFMSYVLLILSTLIAVLVPTTNEMAAIVVLPKIANSETVRDLGDGVVELAREWIRELRPKNGHRASAEARTKGETRNDGEDTSYGADRD